MLGDMDMEIYLWLLYVCDYLCMKIKEINLFVSIDLYKIIICK